MQLVAMDDRLMYRREFFIGGAWAAPTVAATTVRCSWSCAGAFAAADRAAAARARVSMKNL